MSYYGVFLHVMLHCWLELSQFMFDQYLLNIIVLYGHITWSRALKKWKSAKTIHEEALWTFKYFLQWKVTQAPVTQFRITTVTLWPVYVLSHYFWACKCVCIWFLQADRVDFCSFAAFKQTIKQIDYSLFLFRYDNWTCIGRVTMLWSLTCFV